MGIGYVQSYEPSQTMVVKWATINITNGVAFMGFLY